MFGILGFKVALCLAYLRIMRTTSNKTYRYVVWIVLGACTVGHVAGTLVLIFQCSPVRKSWLPLTPGKCLPNNSTFYALAAVTIVFDVIVFFLPIPLLLNLNIELSKKLALCGVFLLGLLTTICSFLRIMQISAIATTGNSTMLVLWGVIELNIGVRRSCRIVPILPNRPQIILTCIPTLGPLIPCFRSASGVHAARYNRNAYQLSSITRNGRTNHSSLRSGTHRSTGHATGPGYAPYDKYGDYRLDIIGPNKGVSDSSNDEDRVRLKEGMGESNILKTTDISVSDEDQRMEGHKDARAFTRTW